MALVKDFASPPTLMLSNGYTRSQTPGDCPQSMCNRDCPQFDPPLPAVWGQAPSRYHPSVRLAVFTPLPPTRSGIADYAVELLHDLGSRHQIQVYVASTQEVSAWTGRGAPFTVHGAHDFVWTHRREPYELVFFQIGNAWCHDYMWPYVFRYPGLVVLHDAQLHHARAWSLLRRARTDDYRAELAFNHPGLPPEAAEPAISGFGGPLYYAWPMLRAVVSSARHVAVHNPVLADDLRRAYSGTPIDAIRMGVRQPATTGDAIATIRARHGIASDAIVIAAFGGVADEKRIGPLLNAVSVARAYEPRIRVLLVGQALPHYDALSIARDLGLDEIVTGTGYVPDHEVGSVPWGRRHRLVPALADGPRDIGVVAACHRGGTGDDRDGPRRSDRYADARSEELDGARRHTRANHASADCRKYRRAG